jgi:hypothetical protein
MRGAFSILSTWKLLASTVVASAWVVLGANVHAQQASAGIEFAPGVLTTIPPQVDPADTVAVHDMVEIRAQVDLQRTPKLLSETRTLYEMADDAEFRRDVWCLEFSFKPMRMLEVELPQPTGKMQRKLVWYMVYRVRNTGAGLAPQQNEDGTYTTVEQSMGPQRFVPQLMLASLDRDRQGRPVRKSYMDRVMPTAVEAISRRELRQSKLLNSVEISEKLLEPEAGRGVGGLWGVATWEDVDPEIDFFAVFVSGLTNAYQWKDAASFEAGATPGTGRSFTRKVLQLNFWRPGDSHKENESEIRYGPAPGMADYYNSPEGIAYQWVYR